MSFADQINHFWNKGMTVEIGKDDSQKINLKEGIDWVMSTAAKAENNKNLTRSDRDVELDK